MTKGSNDRPTRRLMSSDHFQRDRYVVELREGLIAIRPYRARRGGPGEVTVTASGVYVRAMMARAELARAIRRTRGRRR